MTKVNYIGRLVYSKSGRDAGRPFIIVDVINDEYVHICDGHLRPVEKPKKKKIKHLNITDIDSEQIEEMFKNKDRVSNREIRKYLQHMNSNKEV